MAKPEWQLVGPYRQYKWPPFLEWLACLELRLPGKIYRIYAEGNTEAEAISNVMSKLTDHPWKSLDVKAIQGTR